MLSGKLVSIFFLALIATLYVSSVQADHDRWQAARDWDTDTDKVERDDDDDDSDDGDNVFARELEDMFMRREDASTFSSDPEERDLTLAKRKHDPEEIKEIEFKNEKRRKKAFDNYEESCKIKGKFTVRSCPKLSECYAKNKLPYKPIGNEPTTVKPPVKLTTKAHPNPKLTTAKPKTNHSVLAEIKHAGRAIILRELANQFLKRDLADQEDDDDNDDDDDLVDKRFLFNNKTEELAEETKERRGKAFKKYEEYCEKRKFRFGAVRVCPPLNQKLC